MNEPSQKIIALLTDFGIKGKHYVAAMKGIILKINPSVNVIDISHEISPFSIIEASYMIKSIYKFFPDGTIFVLVIDPGVGSNREILALKSKSNFYFIGPNNGLFSIILKEKGIRECVEIKNDKFFNQPVSSTFHGRDIMAPVAAHLSKGVSLNELGPYYDLNNIIKNPLKFQVNKDIKEIKATVLYIDTFGNITLNIPIKSNYIKGTSIPIVLGNRIELKFESEVYEGIISPHFSNAPKGTLIFLTGSSGFLEISKNQDSASLDIGCKVGDLITISLK